MREAEEILRLASERRQAGIGLKADELRARVRLSEGERRLLSAENDLLPRRLRLAQAMGREPGEVGIAGPVDPQQLLPAPTTTACSVPIWRSLQRRAEEAAIPSDKAGPPICRAWERAAHPKPARWRGALRHRRRQLDGRGGITWEIFDGGARRYASARAPPPLGGPAAGCAKRQCRPSLAVEEAQRRAEEARLQTATAAAGGGAKREESFRLTRAALPGGAG